MTPIRFLAVTVSISAVCATAVRGQYGSEPQKPLPPPSAH
jgi:hypothetical protein